MIRSPEKRLDRRLCVAPMMDWTDRHCRYFHRLLAPDALLYTEMVTTGAIIHGDRDRHLAFHSAEHPVAVQLGGSDPTELAACARIAEDYGYDEINLNVGCPSDRVQSGRFGACLMREPELVRDCLGAMIDAVSVPVTVKHRLGVDDQDPEADLERFVSTVADSGCRVFIVHARKAWLEGLSPKENRDVPPLDYERVYRLKNDHPRLEIVINGGIDDAAQLGDHLKRVDGVMLGRLAYQHPWSLAEAQGQLFGTPLPERAELVEAMEPYVDAHLASGGRLHHITRHMLGLFHGQVGAKRWRRLISQNAWREGMGKELLREALEAVTAGTPALEPGMREQPRA